MVINIRRLGVLVALTMVLFLGGFLVALSYTDIGLIDVVDATEETSLSLTDLSAVPQSVVEDANETAQELLGDYQDKYDDFVHQLLAAYMEARDTDVVVVFNSGGWGWKLMESSPGWYDISNGIKDELNELGYTSVLLNHQRTRESLRGVIDEFAEVLTAYPSKGENLACRVEFLTEHNPDLKVIVTGESNGTVISDDVMKILRDNPRVYSIQTGTPFWHRHTMGERTLVVNDNGIRPDALSQGDVPTILWDTAKGLLGLIPPEEEDKGRIFYFLRAPGHDYRWQYPGVYSQITDFLNQNFSFKQG